MSLRRTFHSFLFGAIACELTLSGVCALTPIAPAAPTEPVAPEELKPWPITRYEKMIRKSPFAPATVAPVVAVTPGFATNLYMSGLGKIGDRDFVSISSRDQTIKFSLFAGETSSQGIQFISAQWADGVGKSKVTVKKGTEFGVLEYDQAIIAKNVQMAPPNIQQPGQPMRPIMIPQPGQPNQQPMRGGFNGQPGNGQPAIPVRRRSIIRNQN